MIRYENDCVGCPQGCINCGRRSVQHLYCDKCDEEYDAEDLYDVDGEMLCIDCIKMQYRTIADVGAAFFEQTDTRAEDEYYERLMQDF